MGLFFCEKSPENGPEIWVFIGVKKGEILGDFGGKSVTACNPFIGAGLRGMLKAV